MGTGPSAALACSICSERLELPQRELMERYRKPHKGRSRTDTTQYAVGDFCPKPAPATGRSLLLGGFFGFVDDRARGRDSNMCPFPAATYLTA